MSCNNRRNGPCCPDTPYPQVSHESVPSLIDNLVNALYGTITKCVKNGRVIWNIPCDPSTSPATYAGVPREPGEGLLCYIIRLGNSGALNGATGPIGATGPSGGPTGATGPNGATGIGMPVGGAPDKLFFENDIVMTDNYTITSGKNAMSAGPITVNPGVVLTVPSGSVYTIV